MSEFMKGVELEYLTVQQAHLVAKTLKGTPTENRVLVATPTEVKKTKSGLFIPGDTKDMEGIPRIGVIIQTGPLSEEYQSYRSLLEKGNMIHYGIYAGKEIAYSIEEAAILEPDLVEVADQRFAVLALNEIVYVEPNKR